MRTRDTISQHMLASSNHCTLVCKYNNIHVDVRVERYNKSDDDVISGVYKAKTYMTIIINLLFLSLDYDASRGRGLCLPRPFQLV